jgi:hypothetical protein
MYLAYANQTVLMMARYWAETCCHLHLNVIYVLVVSDGVYLLIVYYLGLCKYTSAQRRNRPNDAFLRTYPRC